MNLEPVSTEAGLGAESTGPYLTTMAVELTLFLDKPEAWGSAWCWGGNPEPRNTGASLALEKLWKMSVIIGPSLNLWVLN